MAAMAAMTGLWRALVGPHEPVSKQFEHMLMREVMRTELIRVRAVIVVSLVIMVNVALVHELFPNVVESVWHGVNPHTIYRVLIGLIVFEVWVHTAISKHLQRDEDLNVYRRYLGALIETSIPTFVLALQIESMGPVRALGFVMPLVYFIFVILSTLRLDFWLSTFTGFVAASELLAVALYYNSANAAGEPLIYFHAVRSAVILICGVLAGSVGAQLRRQFGASITAATARDRVTNLFGQ